jgi:hypothetical protein
MTHPILSGAIEAVLEDRRISLSQRVRLIDSQTGETYIPIRGDLLIRLGAAATVAQGGNPEGQMSQAKPGQTGEGSNPS